DTISKWRFSPATDSNGKPVASSKTEYIDFKN
ncbi:MAG: energy transducer TonB, partial [Veillonella sp.]|nr:energy transducer TonB [Veillonella sp.]